MTTSVAKRLVLFLGGFDPRGGRHYYSQFKDESGKMAQISGARIDVSPRKRLGSRITQWTVEYQEAEGQGDPVKTEFRTLNYDDIVRRFWIKSELSMIKKMVKTYFLLWRNGGFQNRWRVIKPIVYMGVLFIILLVSSLLLLTATLLPLWFLVSAAVWVKLLLSLLVIVLILVLGRIIDKKINHYWLIRGICFSGSQEQYDDPEYEDRMQFFMKQLLDADQEAEFDEIQIVGHSSGSIWATEVVGRALLEDEKLGKRTAQVNLLTLGSCIGLMAGTKIDKGYHRFLEAVGLSKQIDWLDVSEGIDFAANYMVDPIALLPGIKDKLPEQHLPRLRRPRFFKLFEEETFKELKKDAYRVHFQFIHSSEKDGEYNYFRFTCGSSFLREQLV